jgi:CheY-like chemotaxis protein
MVLSIKGTDAVNTIFTPNYPTLYPNLRSFYLRFLKINQGRKRMRILELASESRRHLPFAPKAQRLSVVVADGSTRYLNTVCALEEFHEIVDLVGRATNFEETIELALDFRPDLVLMDIEMASAHVAMAAILLTTAETKIIGVSAADSIPLESPSLILSFSALLHQSRLREQFLPALNALYRYPASLGPVSVWQAFRRPARERPGRLVQTRS